MTKDEILKKYKPVNENLIMILHDFQNNNPEHYLEEEDLKIIAHYLNTTYSAVYGVVKYYSMFSMKPRGKFIIRVCGSPVCEMAQVVTVLTTLRKELGINIGETSDDHLFTLEMSECLGHCDHHPVIEINEEVYGNLNVKKIKKIIAQKRKEAENENFNLNNQDVW